MALLQVESIELIDVFVFFEENVFDKFLTFVKSPKGAGGFIRKCYLMLPAKFRQSISKLLRQRGGVTLDVLNDRATSSSGHKEVMYSVYGANFKKSKFSSVSIENSEDHPFEGFVVPLAANKERILEDMYGDFMSYPPIEQRVGSHHDLNKIKFHYD